MGDIIFHLTPEEQGLLLRKKFAAPLSSEEAKEASVLEEMDAINRLFGKADQQKSPDGYGIEDRSKT